MHINAAWKQAVFLWCARQGAPTWERKSPTGPTRGTVSWTARVSTVRWNLKEAAGKALARRTETVYEAVVMGEESIIFKARYLYGNHGSRYGGYKCEGGCALPGEICRYVISESVDNRRREASLNRQKSADDIVGGIDPTEGRNMEQRMGA